MTSPTRKRGPEEGEEGDDQSTSKFLITQDKPIPATNTKDVYLCKTSNKQFKSFQALGNHRVSHNFKNSNSVGADLTPEPVLRKVYECQICHEKLDSGQALGGHMTKHRSSGKEEKAKSESSGEKTVLENITTSKSDSNRREKSVGDKSGCNFLTLVTRDFFPMEPSWDRAKPVEVVPVLERANSWLDLKLGI